MAPPLGDLTRCLQSMTIQGSWVFGALINNQWLVAGWGDKDEDQMLLQRPTDKTAT